MLLQLALTDYLQALRYEQGAAATTRKGYGAMLRHFHRWMTTNGYAEPTVEPSHCSVL